MDSLEKNIAKLKEEIAAHREDLIEAQGLLKDDEQYLKDLTARCEDRAHDYDQRSQMRADEITALSQALDVLQNKVESETEVNKRAAFIQQRLAEIAAEK